jgi:hypothetical protein
MKKSDNGVCNERAVIIIHKTLLTKSMEQNHSREANNRSGNQEIPKTKGSLQCLQEPANVSYPKLNETLFNVS